MTQAQTGAVTLIQRFGSAANLNIHLHCLTQITKRVMKVLTRKGALIEEASGIPSLTDTDRDPVLAPLQAAACTYRIALGPRAGRKVLTWRDQALSRSSHEASDPPQGCVNAQGFSLHADGSADLISGIPSNASAAISPALPLVTKGCAARRPAKSCFN